MASQEAKRVVRNTAPRSEQDHRYRLMRYLKYMWREGVLSCDKVQAAINYAQFAPFQPDQPMAISMWDTCCLQSESPL